MKIVYYTSPYFLDCDFPLLKAWKNMGNIEVLLIIVLTPDSLKTTLLNMGSLEKESGIYPIVDFPELLRFRDYYDVDNAYVAVRKNMHFYSIKSFILQKRIYDIIKGFHPDIVQLTLYPTEHEPFLYFFRNKVVQLVHDPFPHTGEARRMLLVNIKLSTFFFKNFIMLNKCQREAFINKYHLARKRVDVSQLGIYECMNEFRNAKTTIDKTNYILFFGRISPYKGIDYLINAVKRMTGDVQLIIAGGGTVYFPKSLYEGDCRITLINRYIDMSELYELISNCGIVVCPYTDATQSGVVMTAYSLYKPVIVTDVGGLPEMVDDGKTGFVIPRKSVEALYKVLEEIYSNPSILQTLSDNIKKKYLSGVGSWQAIANQYLSIYTNITKCQE